MGTTRQQRSKAGPISSALSDPVLKISLLGRPRKTSNVKERFRFFNCELVVRKDLQEHHNPVRFSCLDIPGHLKSQCSTLTSSAPTQMIKAWTRVTLSPAFGVVRSMFRRAGLVIQQSQRKKLRFTAEWVSKPSEMDLYTLTPPAHWNFACLRWSPPSNYVQTIWTHPVFSVRFSLLTS